MSCKVRLLVLLPLLAAAACNTAYQDIGSADPAFGEAVKYDMAVQVVDPDPVYPEDGAQPGDNGAKAAAAVRRYRTDETLQRHNREARQQSVLSTTGGSSGGGGSGPQ